MELREIQVPLELRVIQERKESKVSKVIQALRV